MSVNFPSSLQSTFLNKNDAVLHLQDYWKADNFKTFPSQYLALQAVNDKAKQILNAFVNQNPPSSDLVNLSLKNLMSNYDTCSDLENKMKRNEITTIGEQFYSWEFFVMGGPVRDRQVDTFLDNVKLFSQTVQKTKDLKKTFENIVRLSRWPSYHDIIVESTVTGAYTVKRRATNKAVEIVAFGILLLAGIIWIVLKVTQAHFCSVSTEYS